MYALEAKFIQGNIFHNPVFSQMTKSVLLNVDFK